MLTFNNDTKFRNAFVKEIAKHYKADQIVQGTYGEQNGQWHGCYLGCSLRSYDIVHKMPLRVSYSEHSLMEERNIVSEWFSRLGEKLFESLPADKASKFVYDISRAIPAGVDLTPLKWQFSAFLMKENIDRMLGLDIADDLKEKVVSAIRQVLAVHENALQSGVWDRSAAEAAESAARSAAESAAESAEAAESAARSAAWSVARSAWSAESAAWSVAESAASYERYAKELIRLLKTFKGETK